MRSTFDRRLWILVLFVSLQCLPSTDQLNIYTGLQIVPAHSIDVSVTQNGQVYYTSSNILGNTKKNISGHNSTPAAINNSLSSCANDLSMGKHRHAKGNHKELLLKEQHLQPKIPPRPPQRLLASFQHSSSVVGQMPSSSVSPSRKITNRFTNSLLTTTNRLQQQLLQSYLDQQGPPNEDTAQESLELQEQQHYPRHKRTALKSVDISLTSGMLSSEEFTIDNSKNNNKLLSSSDIQKSDIRINKTNPSFSASSSFSSSSSSSSSSPSKSPLDASLLASVPAISSSALLYSQHYLSQESLSSSFEDERTLNSGSRISSSILSLKSRLQMDLANKSQSENRTKQKTMRALKSKEPVIIIDDAEEFDSGGGDISIGVGARGGDVPAIVTGNYDESEYYSNGKPMVMPLRPIIRGPYEDEHDEEMSVVYAEQHAEVRLVCEVDLDIALSSWYKNGLSVHAIERSSRITDYRFVKEINGALTITNVMLEDDGKWQCEAENTNAYIENARPVKLVVLDRPKPPYLLIDSRRLDAGNIFVPVKENSELNLACISEGGNPKPTLSWEVLLSPGVDRHAQKVAAEVLELEEIKKDKEKLPYKMNSGAKSEARLPAVYRAHHNARILCVMEHPTLKIRQNASLLLDVQYTPSFAISRTPGFGYPLREGIEVSLRCDVDSNPLSTPRWQKDDGDTPVPQTVDGFLNFTSIRREHSGWYKCTSRHLNFQYSSIGYYLSVRYDSVDVTSEPDDQDVSVAASHIPNKGQLEVQLGGAVTLQCPQGSLGCWSHLDPVTARLRGLGHGLTTPTGQFSLKDVVYQDAGTYKCIGQSPTNKKKLDVLQTVAVLVKGKFFLLFVLSVYSHRVSFN